MSESAPHRLYLDYAFAIFVVVFTVISWLWTGINEIFWFALPLFAVAIWSILMTKAMMKM